MHLIVSLTIRNPTAVFRVEDIKVTYLVELDV
jgi:hypothetical protein